MLLFDRDGVFIDDHLLVREFAAFFGDLRLPGVAIPPDLAAVLLSESLQVLDFDLVDLVDLIVRKDLLAVGEELGEVLLDVCDWLF